MSKGRFIKKLCAAALSVLMIGGTAAILPSISNDSGFSITANAGGAPMENYYSNGDYMYRLDENNEATLLSYNGSAENVVIPSKIDGFKVTTISAFNYDFNIKSVTIPEGVTKIYGLFSCSSLKSVSIPKTVTTIGGGAFSNTPWLNNQNQAFVVAGDGVLIKYNGNSSSVTIPNSVKSISGGVFENHDEIKSVTIPNSVKSIDYAAFFFCRNLSSISIPGSVSSVSAGAFSETKWLANQTKDFVVVGDGVLIKYNGSASSVTVPNYVKRIGDYAFTNTNITSISIPDSVTEIGNSCFIYCSNLKKVVLPKGLKKISPFMFCSSGITEINIPDGVTTIGEAAFLSCSGLKTVIFPDSVKTIESSAFMGCNSLEAVKIPAGVNIIDGLAFDSTPWLNNLKQEMAVVGNGILIKYNGKGSSATIPNNVKVIGAMAFQNTSVSSVFIPSGVKKIDAQAFMGCANLKSLTIPSSVKYIATNSVGYNSGWISGFTVYGEKGSAAEKYAKVNGLKFSPITEVKSISLNTNQMSLGRGETAKLTATVSPANATNKSVKWRTSDSKILTVDQSGNVKAVNNGTAWITARASNGLEKSCKITVKNAPSKITLTKGILTIGVGESYTIGSGINDGAACAKRTYRTSNSSVVKMTRTDWNGVFVGVKPGVAYVTVRTYNGKESTCKVTVKAAPAKVSLNKTALTLKVGQSASLSAIIPDNAGCAARTFRTSNSSIVKMTKTSWTGEFKAVKKGVAYVTVRTYNGKEASCKVTVQ